MELRGIDPRSTPCHGVVLTTITTAPWVMDAAAVLTRIYWRMRPARKPFLPLLLVAPDRIELPSCIRMKDDAPMGLVRKWGDRRDSHPLTPRSQRGASASSASATSGERFRSSTRGGIRTHDKLCVKEIPHHSVLACLVGATGIEPALRPGKSRLQSQRLLRPQDGAAPEDRTPLNCRIRAVASTRCLAQHGPR